MKKRHIIVIPLIIAFLEVTGCTGMNSNFGCNAIAASGCTPVSVVNRNASSGFYNHAQYTATAHGVSDMSSIQSQSHGYQGLTPNPGQPVRGQEVIQRIWIAPYQDSSNTYHEPSYVYTVLKKPAWIGNPVKAIQTDDEG